MCLQEISICHKYHGTRQRKLQVVINENAFVELLHDHFLERLNTTPTRGNNTLDIVLTNIPNKVKICEILSPVQAELFTDHNIIAFELSMCYNQLPKIRRTFYNYRQGYFARLRSALECLNLDSLITTDNNINHDWQQWKKAFLEAGSQYIPSMRVKGGNYVPWMNSTILHNIKKKNSLRLRIKKSPKPTEYLVEKFKTLLIVPSSVCYITVTPYISTLFVPAVDLIPNVSGTCSCSIISHGTFLKSSRRK